MEIDSYEAGYQVNRILYETHPNKYWFYVANMMCFCLKIKCI